LEPDEKPDPLSALLLVGTEYDPEFPEGETALCPVLLKPCELFLKLLVLRPEDGVLTVP
jgi:hypothetical protein